MPGAVGGAAGAPRLAARSSDRADVGQVPVDVFDRGLASHGGAAGNALIRAGRAGAGELHRAGGRAAVGVLWAGRLTDFDRLGTDPLYEGVLERLLRYADQFPNEISWYLKQARVGALPHQIRT
ncbi:hypothetical protein ACFYZJ_30970 [Streptomyces sp. NPDC001848]|uniref:hypothetical protein n=1 Tax=Streptomyces sp. NPDC001848 TaxID=3364618 RepID=UPI0036D0A10A